MKSLTISVVALLMVQLLCSTLAENVQNSVMRKEGETRQKRDSVNPNCYDRCVARRGFKYNYYCFYRECYSHSTTSTVPPHWMGGHWGHDGNWGGKSWGGKSWGGKSWGGGGKSWGGKSWGGK